MNVTGLIIAVYDIGVILLVVPISHFGGKSHKMRVIGTCFFLLGVGAMIFSLAHFTSGKYNPSLTDGSICLPGAPSGPCHNEKFGFGHINAANTFYIQIISIFLSNWGNVGCRDWGGSTLHPRACRSR